VSRDQLHSGVAACRGGARGRSSGRPVLAVALRTPAANRARAPPRRRLRSWRVCSVRIDGMATEPNGTPTSGSKRSIALTRPTIATCTRSLRGSVPSWYGSASSRSMGMNSSTEACRSRGSRRTGQHENRSVLFPGSGGWASGDRRSAIGHFGRGHPVTCVGSHKRGGRNHLARLSHPYGYDLRRGSFGAGRPQGCCVRSVWIWVLWPQDLSDLHDLRCSLDAGADLSSDFEPPSAPPGIGEREE
jgi:hypothetical protein